MKVEIKPLNKDFFLIPTLGFDKRNGFWEIGIVFFVRAVVFSFK